MSYAQGSGTSYCFQPSYINLGIAGSQLGRRLAVKVCYHVTEMLLDPQR